MLEEGQTIILPAGKLSVRDREILAGIGPATYRTYPARSGETIEDIISKRSIRRDEVDRLNKDINLDSLAGAPLSPSHLVPRYSVHTAARP